MEAESHFELITVIFEAMVLQSWNYSTTSRFLHCLMRPKRLSKKEMTGNKNIIKMLSR